MYTREKLIVLLKIINGLLMILGIFAVALSIGNIVSLITYYRDKLETALTAKSMPGSINLFIVGVIFLIASYISKRSIGDANFYSSYFETDLDGYVKYSDLAEVIGKSVFMVKLQLLLFRIIYMKNYKFEVIDGEEQVVLDSKTCLCECRNCGAPIEKRIYFTGICSYCGSSDLFARVLTDNRFYTIANHMSQGVKKPAFYVSKSHTLKKVLYIVYLSLGIFVLFIFGAVCLNCIHNYNDKEYLTEVLLSGESYSSFALIKADILDTLIWCLSYFLAFLFVVRNRSKKIKCVYAADSCSKYFSQSKTPFILVQNLPFYKKKKNKKRAMKLVRGAIRRRYLMNCTLEKHNNVLQVALAKKIVKDQCPSCGGAIVGAVDENYRCRYCTNIIMGVVRKQ